jgi:hypothetical protein
MLIAYSKFKVVPSYHPEELFFATTALLLLNEISRRKKQLLGVTAEERTFLYMNINQKE